MMGVQEMRGFMGLVCMSPDDATTALATDRFQDKGCAACRSWFDDFHTRTMMMIGVHQMMEMMMMMMMMMRWWRRKRRKAKLMQYREGVLCRRIVH